MSISSSIFQVLYLIAFASLSIAKRNCCFSLQDCKYPIRKLPIGRVSPVSRSFHIHINDYQVVAVNGKPVPLRYRVDTPPVPPYVGPVGKDFVPFGVGFVDLGEVQVEARLTTTDPDALNAAVRDKSPLDPVVLPIGTYADAHTSVASAFPLVKEA